MIAHVDSDRHLANIHRGLLFVASVIMQGLAKDAVVDILLRVITAARMRFSVTATMAGLLMMLYESTLFSDPGVIVPTTNRNRISTNVASTLVSHTPVVTNPGELLHQQLVSEQQDLNEEWVLAPDTYLLRLQNTTGDKKLNLYAGLNFHELAA